MTNVLRPLPIDEFVRLASSAGLELSRDDLEQLERRRLIQPYESGSLGRLHLYLLAVYFEAILVHRHPWAMRASERTLDEVKEIAGRVAGVMHLLGADEPGSDAAESVAQLAVEVERYLATIDPFGPIAGFIDILRPDVIERLRGTGRLYAELRATATALAEATERFAPALEAEGPQTLELNSDEEDSRETVELDVSSLAASQRSEPSPAPTPASATAPAPEQPTGEEVGDEELAEDSSDAEELAEHSSDAEELAEELAEDSSDAEELAEHSSDAEELAEDSLDAEELSEPDVEDESKQEEPAVAAGVADEAPPAIEDEDVRVTTETEKIAREDAAAAQSGFSREETSTGRTRALLDRLEEIKAQRDGNEDDDGADIESGPQESSSSTVADAAPAGEDRPTTLQEKVNELNHLREQLIRAQDWGGLVALYEQRIDLFEDPADRQQVLLTLATLYELKLSDEENAFRCFSEAFDIDVEAGRKRTLESLRKIGKRPEVAPRWASWLEARIGNCRAELRDIMQRDLGSAYVSSGRGAHAFLTYAAFLADEPDERIDAQSLDFLDELSLSVDDDELGGFYDAVLEHAEAAPVRCLVALRAGMFFLGRNEPHHALRCFRIAFDADSSSDIAFSNLSRLYEREENWGDLRAIIARKLTTAEGEEAERLRRELGRVVENELSTEEAIARFGHELEKNPNDEHSLTRLVQSYEAMDRFVDAYGHLNRLLDRSLSPEQEVRVRKHLALIASDHLFAPEEAGHHFQRALELNGPEREILEGLANVRLSAGDWSDAIATLKQLTSGELPLSSDRRKKWLNAGIEAARQAERPEDLRHFQDQLAGPASNAS